jgi:hypothetical protein
VLFQLAVWPVCNWGTALATSSPPLPRPHYSPVSNLQTSLSSSPLPWSRLFVFPYSLHLQMIDKHFRNLLRKDSSTFLQNWRPTAFPSHIKRRDLLILLRTLAVYGLSARPIELCDSRSLSRSRRTLEDSLKLSIMSSLSLSSLSIFSFRCLISFFCDSMIWCSSC